MEGGPQDPDARREWLRSWAAEQQRVHKRAKTPSRVRRTASKMRLRFVSKSRRLADPLLDRGLDTSGSAVQPEHDHPDRLSYVPSAWHMLPRALRYVGVSERDTFVEFGCGKGRVVHQAAKWPFRRVIGVEISPVLAETARATLAGRSHQHRCGSVEIVVADAAKYQVPDDLTIAYLFHPFGDETLDAVLRAIIDSIDRHPRSVRLIYGFPKGAEQVLETGRFRLLKEQWSRLLDTPMTRVAIFESI
jgi:SAM-dependent methyltransferase